MAELRFDYYNNETEYSDGEETENKILDFVKSSTSENFWDLANVEWPMFYHLSPLRENILNWYPFKKNCTVLEVGSGCGAVTGLLCRRAKSVVSVELTKKRAEINFERHKKYSNLKIFVGNLENMRFSDKFDYVIVNGVLEYAAEFISGNNPYSRFLNIASSCMKEDGCLLLAIENRLGLKYFAGAREDHTGKYFVGLNGYPEQNVRTFSKSELIKIIEKSGLYAGKFYYPYPDYKFPQSVYSDDGFSLVPIHYDVRSCDYDRYLFFDEPQMQNTLAKENAAGIFANSFLVDIRKNICKKKEPDICYVKLNADRSPKFQIYTMIFSDGFKTKVKKQPLSEKAVGHLKRMGDYYSKNRDNMRKNVGLLPLQYDGNGLAFDYCKTSTVENMLVTYQQKNNKAAFTDIINEFYKMLDCFPKTGDNLYNSKFCEYFGTDVCKEKLKFFSFHNFDVLFDNVFYKEHKFIIFDYEWCLDCDLPISFVFWRSVNNYYLAHPECNIFVPLEEIYSRYHITQNMISVFYKWEEWFSSRYVGMLDIHSNQKELIPLDNPQTAFNRNYCEANLYVDRGHGFCAADKYAVKYEIKSNKLCFTFHFKNEKNIKRLRFDPLEGHMCICRIYSITANGEKCGFVPYNKFPFYDDADLFLTTDPVYLLNGNWQGKTELSVCFTIKLIEDENISNTVFDSVNKELEKKAAEKEKLLKAVSIAETQNKKICTEMKGLKAQNESIQAEKENIVSQRDAVALEYETVINSACWKLTKPLRIFLDNAKKTWRGSENFFREIGKLGGKVNHNLKTYGLKRTVSKVFTKGGACLSNVKEAEQIAGQVQNSGIWDQISGWIDNTPHEFIDIFPVPMGWDTPLFQRFQHLSLQAGAVGGISIYGAHPLVDKDIHVCKFVTPTLCVINLDNFEIKKKLFEILDSKPGLKFIRLQSIDLATTTEELQSFLARGYEIVYEYIDELTPQIVGSIPQFVFDRHNYVLRDERISVVATSDKLFSQVKPYRSRNMAMINNGVDYAHWNIDRNKIKCPDDLKEIVNQGKIIIGYHGALARWVDYDLLKKIAQDKRFLILLIGYAHDDYLKNSGLLNYDNVYFIGPRPYNDLNSYAAFYDVAILPFMLNDITKSVSPVKIFEYMALGKPIVTYALPECKKYRSCLCADTQEEFISNIDKALDLRTDANYLATLKKEAMENTWQSIMRKTVDMVKENHMYRSENEPKNQTAAEPRAVSIQAPENLPQHGGLYRMLKKAFWMLPILTPHAKENFLYHVKKIFHPSLLQYPPEDAEQSNIQPLHDAVDGGKKIQSDYIKQVLQLPDKSREYVPITVKPYRRENGDCKIIAYYLTQFHPDEHNEKWWGKGVTEWNNVCRAVPQFVGHYQPRLPGELGFYDLRLRDNMARQIELAKMYGIYGFSFYYYWFDGERLLEKPLEAFLKDKTLDFPFSLCWANENWTKRFDGTNYDILMKQPETVESYRNVIHDMSRFLTDSRYITVNGKKLITVYRPDKMPDSKNVLNYWRSYCRENGIGELYIIAVKVNGADLDLIGMGYDAITEFHPGTLYTNCKNITNDIEYIRNDFGGEVFDYRDIVENQKYFKYNLPKLYRAVMPMWDNTARRNNKGMIFQGSTPALYKRWLKDVIGEEKRRSDLDDSMVFINAWNEWGEGAYLEPDKRFGYAYLQATKEAVEETRNGDTL